MKNTLEIFGANAKERVENAIIELQCGKGLLLIDDEDWKNEGDLIFSAEKMYTQDMAQMISLCSGVVCLCLTNEKTDELQLPYMINDNSSQFHTPFTVSIHAKKRATTGLSASDSVTTMQAAAADNAQPADLVRPEQCFYKIIKL